MLRRIQELTSEGLNLAGVQKVLELEMELAEARRERARRRGTARRWPSRRPTGGTDATSCRSTRASCSSRGVSR